MMENNNWISNLGELEIENAEETPPSSSSTKEKKGHRRRESLIQYFKRSLSKDKLTLDIPQNSNSIQTDGEKKTKGKSPLKYNTISFSKTSRAYKTLSFEIFARNSNSEDQLKEGYLNIKKNKAWKKYFVILNTSSLLLFRNHQNGSGEDLSPIVVPLLLCTVKTIPGKPLKFQLLTPSAGFKIEAANEEEYDQWKESIQKVSDQLTQKSIGSSSEPVDSLDCKRELYNIMKLPENQVCADCGKPNPDWASVNLGVFICIECSGAHRQLGTNISRVKSVTLDIWEPHQIQLMKEIGNSKGNLIWEYYIEPDTKKPNPNDPESNKFQFIRDKYELGLYKYHKPLTHSLCSPLALKLRSKTFSDWNLIQKEEQMILEEEKQLESDYGKKV